MQDLTVAEGVGAFDLQFACANVAFGDRPGVIAGGPAQDRSPGSGGHGWPGRGDADHVPP